MEPNFTMWGMFAHATIAVQLVMIVLIVASVWCWAVIVDKWMQYRRARAEARVFDEAFWSGNPLDELFDQIGATPKGQSEKIFASGMLEWRRSHRQDGGLIAGATSRIDRSMDVAIAKETENLQRGLTVLATVGSSAPFIGLFGTVWGIMHSFRGLANSTQATLATVAPGISEALVATAMGLFAAIPAVLAYNRFASRVEVLSNRYDTFMDEFSGILYRQAFALRSREKKAE